MKKILGAICLLLTLLLCLAGCEYFVPKHEHEFSPSYDETSHFQKCPCGEITDKAEHSLEWVVDKESTETENGYKHLECDCGYITEEGTIIPVRVIESEIKTVKLDDELITALSEYLRDFFVCYEIPAVSFSSKIELCKSARNPILVKFSEKHYYVAAYYNEPHEHSGKYCCYDKYTWVGFEEAEGVCESWKGEDFVAAFQINTAELCKNIKTGEINYAMGHFTFYNPEFQDGKALAPQITFKNPFILLTEGDEKTIYYSSKSAFHEMYSFKCVEVENEYYVTQLMGATDSSGSNYESDLEDAFGVYYDQLMSVIINDRYFENYGSSTYVYALININDLARIICEGE